jgi:flagellar basal-body rod protein FlgC
MNSLNVVGSALTAERFRADIITQNLANQNTTRTANGEPYRRKQVAFQERNMNFNDVLNNAQGGGVRVSEVVESKADFKPVYDPDNPDADKDGYVMYPNVDNAEEQVDLMAASRAYETQLTTLSVIKAMAAKALEIGSK